MFEPLSEARSASEPVSSKSTEAPDGARLTRYRPVLTARPRSPSLGFPGYVVADARVATKS